MDFRKRQHFYLLLWIFLPFLTVLCHGAIIYPVSLQANCLGEGEQGEQGEQGEDSLLVEKPAFDFFGSFGLTLLRVYASGVISIPETDEEILSFPLDPYPSSGPGTRLIAPFSAEVDLSQGGSVCVEQVRGPLKSEIFSFVRSSVRDFVLTEIEDPIVVTWREVTFAGTTDPSLNNTFQAVLVNGFTNDENADFTQNTFVILNYQHIVWTTDTNAGGNSLGLGGTPALAGFNAGDGISSFELPTSGTDDIVNIDTASNTGIPGRFLYRVHDDEIGGFTCSFDGPVGIVPSSGSMVGGTRVLIIGPCYNDVADPQIVCKFGDVEVSGTLMSDLVAFCVTPACLQTGHVVVEMSLDGGNTFPFNGIFIYESPLSLPPDAIREVPPDWLKCTDTHTINWNPESLPGASLVDIEVIGYCESPTPRLVTLSTLSSDYENSLGTFTFSVCQPPSTRPNCEQIGAIRVRAVSQSIAIWSDFLPLVWLIDVTSLTPEAWCLQWYNLEITDVEFLDVRQPCPCTLAQSRIDGGRFEVISECRVTSSDSNNCAGRPGVVHCVRARQVSSAGGGQECCYNVNGALTSNQNEFDGGFAYRAHHSGVAPYKSPGKVPWLSHLVLDEYPRIQCCVSSDDPFFCKIYRQVRPPQSCAGYIQITPAVCGGDPHIQTLDGVRYTFNGHGEFTMIEVGEQEVVLQARNLPLTGITPVATIIKAVGICMANRDTVHVEVPFTGGLDVWVKMNGDPEMTWRFVQFSSSRVLNYNGFTVQKGANRFFSSADSIQISYDFGLGLYFDGDTADPGAITILSTGIQPSSPTRGLLGVWNEDPSDDFIANTDPATMIPTASSPEDIHNMFGLTWEISEADSCLYYRPRESHDSFTDLGFEPSFELPTNPNVVQEDLDQICDGDPFCEFDYLATGDPDFAAKTRQYFETVDLIMSETDGFDTCPPLPNPSNGIAIISSENIAGTATYQCFEGYSLSDDTTRNCQMQATFQWDGSDPACVPLSPTLCVTDPNFSCSVRSPFVGVKQNNDVYIYGIPASPSLVASIDFKRTVDTGSGRRLPPSIVTGVPGNNGGKALKIPRPRRRPGRRFGVFSCLVKFQNCPTKEVINVVVTSRRRGLLPTDGRVTKTVSLGDRVQLSVVAPLLYRYRRLIRWLKNGRLISAWNGKNYATIRDATETDQGIYEIFLRGRRQRNQHTMIILFVRACPEGTYGVGCNRVCTCTNGGLCNELNGKCTCSPGFTGSNCENTEAVEICSSILGQTSNRCRGFLFCLPGKFGCVCGPGYRGIDCRKGCERGFYGAGCTLRCPVGENCETENFN